jgi:hypothetical protein
METPRLPKGVEGGPGAASLVRELAARARPLWPGGEFRVPRVELAADLEAALTSAYSAGRIVRGLEGAERALAAEERGLKKVDQRTGVERGPRVSRLVVLADDASERFYRSVESLVLRHAPRILALRLCVDELALGEILFGRGRVARLILVSHKDAVSAILLALAARWNTEGTPQAKR